MLCIVGKNLGYKTLVLLVKLKQIIFRSNLKAALEFLHPEKKETDRVGCRAMLLNLDISLIKFRFYLYSYFRISEKFILQNATQQSHNTYVFSFVQGKIYMVMDILRATLSTIQLYWEGPVEFVSFSSIG
uniref:Uncharacterized protein n=1 Tax=Arundo donax TaxID=35708 RepID=A0A0A9D2D7_ARUDO